MLGVGTLWSSNRVYQFRTWQYTGQYGVAAYQAEFSDSLLYAPVEDAGFMGTPDAHWDQLMRSSFEEGTNGDVAGRFCSTRAWAWSTSTAAIGRWS